jgi:uncharacterized protein DUF998
MVGMRIEASAARPHTARNTERSVRLALLACGIVAPLIYIATDVIASMRWAGYSYRDQTISELNAIGAPTRPLTIVLGLVGYTFLIAFGLGIWRSARGGRKLRVAGGALVLLGAFSFWAVPFASMHVREAEESLTDTLHLVGLPIAGVLLGAAIGCGAAWFGRWFRIFSIATVLLVLAFGVWGGMEGSRVADNLATPWLGIKERVSVYAYQVWLLVFAIALLRQHLAGGTAGYPGT